VEAEWLLTPNSDAALKSVAGAYLMYAKPLSPLTHVLGLSMCNPVTVSDLDKIEEFYKTREAPMVIDLCPHAHGSLRELLSQRSYRISEFTSVMVRDLSLETPAAVSDIQVRPAEPLDLETYAETLAKGFFGRDEITDAERHLSRVIFSMSAGRSFLAEVEGLAAGCGAMSMRRGVANFYGDATLVAFRARGIQRSIIGARLQAARAAGCELASAGTHPGSTSQRNYERLGFQVAYTKVVMALE
jgi:hypothetical protein